jgi:chromosome segregation ATPase
LVEELTDSKAHLAAQVTEIEVQGQTSANQIMERQTELDHVREQLASVRVRAAAAEGRVEELEGSVQELTEANAELAQQAVDTLRNLRTLCHNWSHVRHP